MHRSAIELLPSLDPIDTIYPSFEGAAGGNRPGFSAQPDDDSDGMMDEEFLNGRDDDGDGQIDEDFAAMQRRIVGVVEALIDYTASAHFQLYRFLEESNERRKPVVEIADGVYPQIVRTTDAILAFNDKYEKAELVNGAVDNLSDDLSALGEALADRIQLEDKVIGALTGEPVH